MKGQHMPKKIMDTLLRQIQRDISANYKEGSRYLTIRKIAEKFSTAYGTAVKAVNKLVEFNMLKALPGSGIQVLSTKPKARLQGKKIALVSARSEQDPFFDAFYQGALECCTAEGISLKKVEAKSDNYNSIMFGDFLCSIEADGIAAIAFDNASLALYRAMVKGIDIVSDVPYPGLPILPVVMTDNFRHGQEAAHLFHKNGFNDILLMSWSPADSITFLGFFHNRLNGFLAGAKQVGITAQYVCLGAPDVQEKVNRFFSRFNNKKAAFSLEMGTNWFLSSQFAQRRIPVKNGNLMMYDSYDDFHQDEGLPQIATVGPSLKVLGRGLVTKLINKWKTGSFSEPLCEMI
jgi:DNA-binding LacI/PurR family transcriptional regulator